MLRFLAHCLLMMRFPETIKWSNYWEDRRFFFFGRYLWSWICGLPEHKNACVSHKSVSALDTWRLERLQHGLEGCFCREVCTAVHTYTQSLPCSPVQTCLRSGDLPGHMGPSACWVLLQPSPKSMSEPMLNHRPQETQANPAKVSTPALLNQQHMSFWLKGV